MHIKREMLATNIILLMISKVVHSNFVYQECSACEPIYVESADQLPAAMFSLGIENISLTLVPAQSGIAEVTFLELPVAVEELDISYATSLIFQGRSIPENYSRLVVHDFDQVILDQKTFELSTNLHSVVIYFTTLFIPAEIFAGCKWVTSIHLVHTNLTQVADIFFGELRNLRDISLNDNKITYITAPFCPDCESLEVIQFSRNFIETVEKDAFADLPNLKFLFFDYNQLTTLDLTLTSRFPLDFNPIEVSTSQNQLVVVHFDLEPESYLRLDAEVFTKNFSASNAYFHAFSAGHLPQETFKILLEQENMTHLIIVSDHEVGSFDYSQINSSSVQELKFINCNISELDLVTLLSALPNLQVLKLIENPIKCYDFITDDTLLPAEENNLYQSVDLFYDERKIQCTSY